MLGMTRWIRVSLTSSSLTLAPSLAPFEFETLYVKIANNLHPLYSTKLGYVWRVAEIDSGS